MRAAFDVGGTFTDFVIQSDSGQLLTGKRLTTYPDPSEACLAGLDDLLAQAGVSWSQVDQAIHATTLGSNIVIERKATGVGLITTAGFRDVLIIGRQKRYQVYDLQIDRPAPLIPRRLIREVSERMLHDGSVLVPLDEESARSVVRDLSARGVHTIAVSLLHSYANPHHERRIAEIVREEAPHVAVSLSHEISPTLREYERTSTTVVNAYVMTAIAHYLRFLQAEMNRRGYPEPLFVMQSSGGIATAPAMEKYPVRMIESGPAAGALMACAYGEMTGCPDLIAFDMGGTTAKLTLIEGGRPTTSGVFELHKVNFAPGSGIPMNIQAIDLVEVGSGGGSIAKAERGVIAVGPESAGSSPGPACYGRGGAEPTVTDANLVLGYLNADYFAGGTMRLDAEAARRAIEARVARPLALSVEEAAWGIHQVVTSNMELAARVVSIERGRDPRTLTLIAFGGAGPLHGCRMARALAVPRVILPVAAGVTAALGLLAAEIRFDIKRTYFKRLDKIDVDHVAAMYRDMEQQALDVVRESGVTGHIAFIRSADVRYSGQGYELSVALPSARLGSDGLAAFRAAFDQAYAARYGYASEHEPAEVVNWHLSAVGSSPTLELPRFDRRDASLDDARKGERRAFFPETRGFVACPVYDRYRLASGLELAGPAIVEERESTTVLPPGTRARIDGYGSVIAEAA